MFRHLDVRGLTVTFGGVDVVKAVDFEVRAGEIHALTGENGAGKSSIGKAISGVYSPRSGRILMDGQEVAYKNPREALAAGLALIHQEPLSFPDLTVAENVYVGHIPGALGMFNRKQMRAEAASILAELGSRLDVDLLVGGLSVAERQIVELASAMSHKARVWIFDETTAPLSPKETAELFEVMLKLRDSGCGIVMVTHRLEEVFRIANRVTVLRDGQKVFESETANTDVREVVRNMVGREVLAEKLQAKAALGETLLKAKALSGPGFERVSFELQAGEVVGLAGLIGAGRTELARVLFGLAKSKAGSIELRGRNIGVFRSPWAAKAASIALVPEDRQREGLFTPQSISFNATLASLSALSKTGWLRKAKERQASNSFAERLNLAFRSLDQPVAQLSGGNQQKVVLAKWLMTEPEILILDEPTRGVDIGAKHEVHKLIRAQADSNKAILMISSDLAEILAVCDRVLVMREGRLVGEFGSGVSQEAIMAAATGTAA